jgi:peptidoglycan/LPS O-acetylase OafA/YrhL
MTDDRSDLRIKGYVPELDGVRALAIGLVLLHHVWTYGGTSFLGVALSKFAEIGWCGVDVFFGLSGFLITGILLDTKGRKNYWKSFYIRRSLRIFPLYYVTIGALWAVYLMAVPRLGIQTGEPAGPPWVYFLYLTNFAVTWNGDFGFLPLDVSWSLAIEEQFYLFWPLLIARLSIPRILHMIVAVLILSPLVRVAVFLANPDAYAPAYVFLFGRLDALAIGALAAWLARYGSRRAIDRFIGMTIPACLGLVALYAFGLFDRYSLLFVVLGYSLVPAATASLVLGLVAGRFAPVARVFRAAPLVAIGKISYGLYLLHLIARALIEKGPIGARFGLADHPESLAWATAHFAAVTALAIGLAAASWFAFEKPILSLKSKLAPRPD